MTEHKQGEQPVRRAPCQSNLPHTARAIPHADSRAQPNRETKKRLGASGPQGQRKHLALKSKGREDAEASVSPQSHSPKKSKSVWGIFEGGHEALMDPTILDGASQAGKFLEPETGSKLTNEASEHARRGHGHRRVRSHHTGARKKITFSIPETSQNCNCTHKVRGHPMRLGAVLNVRICVCFSTRVLRPAWRILEKAVTVSHKITVTPSTL